MRKLYLVSALVSVLNVGVLQGAVVLNVDLSVLNHVRIIGTGGSSDNSVAASDLIGSGLEQFFTLATGAGFDNVDHVGLSNLVSSSDASDNSPLLFNSPGNRLLNIFDLTTGINQNFTSGLSAFTGTGFWMIPSADYLLAPAFGVTGNVRSPADTDDDIGTLVGTWQVTAGPIPEPSTYAMLFGFAMLSLITVRRLKNR